MSWLMNAFALRIFGIVPLNCTVRNYNFFTTLRWTFCIVMGVNTVFFGAIAIFRLHSGPQSQGRVKRTAYCWIAFNYVAYVSVSTIFFGAVPCERFDDGRSFLRADYSISCDGDDYEKHFVLAVIGVVTFVFGVPMVFFAVLFFENRRAGAAEQDAGAAEQDVGTNFTSLAFLTDSYRKECYWMEPVICLQKVTVGGVLVFLTAQTARVLFGIVIAAIWVTRISEFQAFPTMRENYLNDFLNLCMILILLSALSLHLDMSDLSGFSLDATRQLLWFCTLAPFASVIAIVLNDLHENYQEQKDYKNRKVGVANYNAGSDVAALYTQEEIEIPTTDPTLHGDNIDMETSEAAPPLEVFDCIDEIDDSCATNGNANGEALVVYSPN